VSTIAAVNTALAAVLDDTGLRVYEYVPEDLNPPALFLALNSVTRGTMARGTMILDYEAVVFVSRASDRAGMAKVYAYLDPSSVEPKSVWAALDENRALGRSDCDATVSTGRILGIEEQAAYGYFGVVFDIQVLTTAQTLGAFDTGYSSAFSQ